MAQVEGWVYRARRGVPVFCVLMASVACATQPEAQLDPEQTGPPAANASVSRVDSDRPMDSDPADDAVAEADTPASPDRAARLSGSLAGARAPLLSVELHEDALALDIRRHHADLKQLRLVLTGPHGLQQVHTFSLNERMQMPIQQADGSTLPDGIYKYEVAPLRTLVSGAVAAHAAEPIAGESLRQTVQRRRAETPVQASSLALDQNGRDATHTTPATHAIWYPTTGVFRIANGRVVLPIEESQSEASDAKKLTPTQGPVAPRFNPTQSPGTLSAGGEE
jgi:hypothetical protein